MGLFKSNKLPYVSPNRLADVLALIQVLALDKYRHRSDKGLTDEMQGPPRSGSSWKEIAQQHPEFFRVSDTERLDVSLMATHVLPKDKDGNRELSSNLISSLLQTAINLHDRQLDRAHRWRAYIPILGVILAIILGFGSDILKRSYDDYRAKQRLRDASIELLKEDAKRAYQTMWM